MILGVGNNKGGTGKSSMSGLLAKELSKNSKVIICDLDGQGNTSDWCLSDDQFKEFDIGDVLQKKADATDAIVNVREDLDILPCYAIGGELKRWSETDMMRVKNPFHKLFRRLHDLGYNYIVCDTSPSMSSLEREIFSAVDEVVIVAGAERFSFEGIENFMKHLKEIKENMDGTFIAEKLILNRVNKSFGAHKGYLKSLEEKGDFNVFLFGQTQSVANAQVARQFLDEHDPKNKYLPVIENLVEAL